jgi:hypothetical protein
MPTSNPANGIQDFFTDMANRTVYKAKDKAAEVQGTFKKAAKKVAVCTEDVAHMASKNVRNMVAILGEKDNKACDIVLTEICNKPVLFASIILPNDIVGTLDCRRSA